MKICHILTADPYKSIGGTPIAAMSIINYSKSNGIDSIVKYGIGRRPLNTFIYPIFLALRLVKNDYDIIHIHDAEGYWYTFLPKFLRKNIVYTSHGETTEYYNVMKPKGLVRRLKAKVAIMIQKRLVTQADVVVAVSDAVKKWIIKYYNVSSDKIVVIHNGVNTKKFKPLKKKKIHDDVKQQNTAIWVGTNSEVKGLEKAIEYAKKRNMMLLVVGVEGANADNVKFMPSVPYAKMPEVYNMAKLLLYFSSCDGHPLVPMEAMACGLDIIASKESNIEIIPHEKDGAYKIKGNDALRAVKKYDWEIQASKYVELYGKIVKK